MAWKKGLVLIVSLLAVVSCVVLVVDDSDGAGSYTARVFVENGNSYTELEGSGGTVREIIQDAVKDIEINAAGQITKVNGEDPDSGKQWIMFQWVPPTGWEVKAMNSVADMTLENGTTYAICQSQGVPSSSGIDYTEPDFQPESEAYFYIVFRDSSGTDVTAPGPAAYFGEEQWKEGVWISGTGSNGAYALREAAHRLGFEIDMSEGVEEGKDPNPDYIGWLYSFMGLKDVSLDDGKYKYWSQFYWDGSKWVYGECLGHYDPGVIQYYALVRQITDIQNTGGNQPTVTPSDCPASDIRSGCDVSFVDYQGKTLKTQHVGYFSSATPPQMDKTLTVNGSTINFKGWDTDLRHIISDVTVRPVYDGEIQEATVSSVEIISSISELSVGGTGTLSAKVSPSGAPDGITWSSSNTSVATISSTGQVRGVSEGTVTIKATSVSDPTKSDSVTIKVVSGPVKTVPVSSVTLDPSKLTLRIDGDESRVLNATVFPSDATNKGLRWTSSNTGVVTVDSSGKVVAVSPGTAIVTVTTEDGAKTSTCVVTVEPKEGEIAGVAIGFDSLIMQSGDSIPLVCSVDPGDVEYSEVWTTSDKGVVKVDNGAGGWTLTATGAGNATVTVKVTDASGKEHTAVCKVKVVSKGEMEELTTIDVTDSDSERPAAGLTKDYLTAVEDTGFEVRTSMGSVAFSSEATSNFLDKYQTLVNMGFSPSVMIGRPGTQDNLDDAQWAVIGNSANAFVLSVFEESISNLGGKATVSLRYTPVEGEDTSALSVYCVGENGSMERFDCVYDPVAGTATFETTHLSLYYITAESPDESSSDGSPDDGGMMYIAIAAVAIIAVAAVAFVVLRKRV